MSVSARATVWRWALLSLHGAEVLGVLTVAVAAESPPLLPQPAAANPSTAPASARAPDAGTKNGHILTEPNRVVWCR